MPAPVIVSVTNQGDGQSVVVVLATATIVKPTLYYSQFGNILGAALTPSDVAGAGTTWTATVVSPDEVVSSRRPCYVTAELSAQKSNQAFDWLSAGSNLDDITLGETSLHNVLSDNKLALDRALQNRLGGSLTFPDGTPAAVQKVIRGMPVFSAQGKFPAISVRVNRRVTDPDWGLPSTDKTPMSGTLYAYHQHQTKVSHEWVGAALGMAITDLLNQNEYRTLPLADGERGCIYESLVKEVRTSEAYDRDEGQWYVVAECPWVGQLSRARTG